MSQSKIGFKPSAAIANPSWLSGWPTRLGESWLLKQVDSNKPLIETTIRILWLLAGLCFAAAVVGILGSNIVLLDWRLLVGIGAIISLVLLILYAHPLYGIGLIANLAALILLFITRWPTVDVMGS